MKSGIPEEAARRQVRLEFGGLDQIREQCDDVRPWRWVERLLADCRFSLRAMRRSPVLSATMFATVALCVGVNAAVYTVVDSLLIRPLPFPRADRLVVMTNLYPKAGVVDQDATAPGDYFDRKDAMPAVESHALYQFVNQPVEHGGAITQVRGVMATSSLFEVLHVLPARGQFFTPSEMDPGKSGVVVLTDEFAREAFATGDPLGQTIRINGLLYSVSGVLPPTFRFLDPDVKYIVPLVLLPQNRRQRHSNSYRYLARLREGATVAQAQAQVNAINARVLDEMRELKQLVLDAGFQTQIEQLQPWITRNARSSLGLLWAGALLVMLVGVANFAGLAMARTHSQIPELATRISLGATRWDVVQRALTDGIIPALLGGVVGATVGILASQRFDHGPLPGASAIAASPVVIVYALLGAVLAGVFMGLLSLWPARSLELSAGMRTVSRGHTAQHTRLRGAFVVVQAALAFALLNGAGVLVTSIRELLRVDPGYRLDGVWTASTFLPPSNYSNDAELRSGIDRLLLSLRSMPGVELAGAGSNLPLSTGYNDNVILAEGYTIKPGESAISPISMQVTPGYLESLDIRAVEGRLFDERDTVGSQGVIIVDERLAKRFWRGQSPIGRQMFFPGSKPKDRLTVVGVVRSVRLENLAGTGNPNGVYYRPWAQSTSRQVSLIWRGNAASAAALRSAFARLAPGAALFEMRSMPDRLERTLTARRTALTIVLVFAGVAVLLTAIGVYGLLAFLVAQRRREIGIRLAIGSRPWQIFRQFLSHGLGLIAAGVLAGLALSAAMRPLVEHHLYGVRMLEPAVLALVVALIGIVSMMAIGLPSLRASRVDPIQTLREN
jgi:predicted permease